MITWIVQENLAGEKAYDSFIEAIKEVAPLKIIKVVPFGHDLIPEVEGTDNIAFGSLTLERIARARNWKPGTFTNNSHSFDRWAEGYRGFLLNEDATIHPFGSVPKFTDKRFIRPLADSKVFAGMVIDGDDFEQWQAATLELKDEFSTLTADTPVLIASEKEVEREYRFFVVDKQVITGSQYKEWNYTRKRRIDPANSLSDKGALKFASEMVARWQPARHFVIDVCQVGLMGDFKVVEINSLTSAGFYDCDMPAVVKALHESLTRMS